MKILGTGMRGLVGSRVQELLGVKYEFGNIDRTSGVDITNAGQVFASIGNSNAEIVIHLAAKTDVDGCEKDKPLGKEGEAWKINVDGTQNVANACLKSNKKLIYISTDFVFDGNIPEGAFYKEEDSPNPINWYAKTKHEGERVVQNSQNPWLIVRLAYPYRAKFKKNDFFRAILGRLQDGQTIDAVVDHVFCPTFIDDVVLAIDKLIGSDSQGIFHVVGSEALTPYDAANIIAEEFDLDASLIRGTTREKFFADKAERPMRLALRNDKIRELGINMRGFREGLIAIKNQLANI
ncbi:MAG: SDR family oxidoreductase [Candidatus Levybacteria bacterium]|nr:SDR family oxidoreductase [Candidatus Levybacteria bacterium]